MVSGLLGGLPFEKEAKQTEMTIQEQLTSLPGINNINKKQKKGIDGTFEYMPSNNINNINKKCKEEMILLRERKPSKSILKEILKNPQKNQ